MVVSEDALQPYREKRRPDVTPEPAGVVNAGSDDSFVVQKHAARRLHYDVRFEVDGVMASWAVPKGPSYDPRAKRLAVHVEDHPLDYRHFEGTIPDGNYGAGTVIVWDQGTYRNLTEHHGRPVPVRQAIDQGHLSIWLEGSQLRGGWSLTRTGRGDDADKTWIMVKRRDEHADPSVDITATAGASVQSGLDLDEVAAEPEMPTWTAARATWQPPMLAELTKAPAWLARAGTGWNYERKLDGLRCLAVRNGSDVGLWSRNHNSFTARFPGVVGALVGLPVDNFCLDGELVAFDGQDFAGFGALQQGTAKRTVYCVFDVLHLLGRDTRDLSLTERKGLLEQMVEPATHLQLVPVLEGEPDELLARACQQRWEGLIAKRDTSTYTGGRSPDWRKLKCSASQELIIGGWTAPQRSRLEFGALLVGYHEGDSLRYAGKVGTGFTNQTLRTLHAELVRHERPTSPFTDQVRERTAHWVEPELVAAITFAEWTRDGRLRHPSFQGLRPDKDPRSVTRERAGE